MAEINIQTAIPKRRYRIGEFTAVVLGEVESEDRADYRYIMAVVDDSSIPVAKIVPARSADLPVPPRRHTRSSCPCRAT